MHIIKQLLIILLLSIISIPYSQAQFTIADPDAVTSIVYDIEHSALDSIAAHLLSQDITAVTNKRPQIFTSLDGVSGNVIVIGDVNSPIIKNFVDTSSISGQWEMYTRVFKKAPAKGIVQAMFIVGSDPRAAAYGVFDLSKEIGVSPWYWWADVPIEKQNILQLSAKDMVSKTPKVKFRGIFINDEGWGLEPWASKTFEPTVGNLGPKTYAKIFELLLRLKGNTIWPGMHPNTKPFFTVPANAETADKWEIVVGTSHAEPMLRNNVGEWDAKKMGRFNYQNNASSVFKYWEERVQESIGVNAIYTVGMRGVHDSGMEGFASMEAKVKGLEQVIADQRKLLSTYINKDVTKVPQSFTAYKEVLKVYESGLEIPDDVTIMWPDDNFGNIKRFSNHAEQQRSGGTGFYYHLSYLGAPHPYIWLSPMTPALVWRELTRASQQQMNEIWIANVGDLKRREWGMEFFLDLAWDIDSWKPENKKDYFEVVAARDISKAHGKQIAEMMWEYYRLANERKPEAMGFNASQWNGWPPIRDPLYSLWNYNDEVEQRIHQYQALESKAKTLMSDIPPEAKDTYFQLVYYPIAGATAMNKKWLYAYKSREYAKQGRAVANAMSDSAFAAFEEIQRLTTYYNEQVANGKWKHSVDYSPSYKKGSLVFWEPISKRIVTDGLQGIGVAIEGQPEALAPIQGGQPAIVTRESTISIPIAEANISGEMVQGTDEYGTFISWPQDGSNRNIPEPHWDVIPYEIKNPTKAVFEFDFEVAPGGIHTLNLSVEHPDQDSDSWYVTLNDRPPYATADTVGRIQQLKAHDFVLKPGLNTLTVHPKEDGVKLYGIEFVQRAQQLEPRYTKENRLPTFNPYIGQRHFIDVFSRGTEIEKWTAKTSAPWIELSHDKGELHGDQDRIWVSVNYKKTPSKQDLRGYITITNGDQQYQVVVAATNPQAHPQVGTFMEANGSIAIPANQFQSNQAGEVASWQSITGLGRSGAAMLLQPVKGWYINDLSEIGNQAPALEYELVVTQGGTANIVVEAVPAFPLNPNQQLHCAVSIGDRAPQWVNFKMADEEWGNHVLEGRMPGSTQIHVEPGTHRLKLWGTDPSVNIDRIVIDFGGVKPSYTGPLPTRVLND